MSARARLYIASGNLVTHAKAQLEVVRQAGAAKQGLALKVRGQTGSQATIQDTTLAYRTYPYA